MEIKPRQIQSFKELYKKKFGIELSDSLAYSKALSLLSYVKLCIKPIEKTENTPE